MLIEYVAFGALVVAALVATLVGLRRRRADRLTADPTATFPYIGSGTSGFGTHHSGHSGLGSNGGGGSFGGAGDGGGGSGGGGGFDGGGGQGN